MSRVALIVVLALAHIAQADPVESVVEVERSAEPAPCAHPSRSCRRVDGVSTRSGTVEVYELKTGYSGGEATEQERTSGGYVVDYTLVFSGGARTSWVRGAGHGTNHPYESCGSPDGWCTWVDRVTPTLRVYRGTVVKLVVKANLRSQHWVDPSATARGTKQVRSTQEVTFTCDHGDDGWLCTRRE